MPHMKAATRRITMWRRLPGLLFTSTLGETLDYWFNSSQLASLDHPSDGYLERVGQILQRHQLISASFSWTLAWFLLFWLLQLEQCQQKAKDKSKKTKAKVAIVAESGVGKDWKAGLRFRKFEFQLPPKWGVVTFCRQGHWCSFLLQPQRSSSHQRLKFSESYKFEAS